MEKQLELLRTLAQDYAIFGAECFFPQTHTKIRATIVEKKLNETNMKTLLKNNDLLKLLN